MNYNYNPYGYGVYQGYQSPYQTPNYQAPQQMQYQQPVQQQAPQQNIMFPFVVLSTLDEVKKYIVGLNQVIYLKANDTNNVIFEKRTDNTGKTTLTPLETKIINLEDIGKPKEEKTFGKSFDTNELAYKSDLLALQQVFEDNMSKLSTQIENAFKQPKSNYNSRGKNNE